MTHIRWSYFAVTVFALLGATCAAAQEQAVTQNGISFVSGGVGADSEERLKAQEKDFNLKLVLTLIEGNYVSGVDVVVKNAAGSTLVEHTAEGPFFMAKLPAGKYTVAATYSSKSQTRKFAIGGKGLHTEYLRWPSDPKTDFTLPPEGTNK